MLWYTIRMQRSYFLFLCVAFVLVGMPSVLSAQFSGGTGTELTMAKTPEHPRPGDSVSVSVESYNIDLNRSEVHWFVNDVPLKTGLGIKNVTVPSGRNGETTTVRVVAIGEDGRTYSSKVIIRPAEVNLLWQAQSYTPPFYKGKALMPYQGTVLVAAVPSFSRGTSVMSAESLIYTWKEGDDVIGDSSGKGRSLFVFRGSIPMRPKTISVTVESPDHTMVAEALVNVVPVAPRLLFYEEHPRYGLLTSKALSGRFHLEEDEVRISALPYYFEINSMLDKAISYDWQANYNPITTERTPSVALRRQSEKAGRTDLFLEAKSTDEQKTFQVAEERLSIEFPEKSGFTSNEATPVQ